MLFFAVEDSDAGWPEKFVSAEHKKINIQATYVHPLMGDDLGRVQKDQGAGFLADKTDHFIHRQDRTDGVGDGKKTHEFGFGRKKFLKLFEDEFATVVHRGRAKNGFFFFTDHLPRDDVGVVFQMGDKDFIAGLEMFPPPGVGYKIDALGGAVGENDFFPGLGVDEVFNFFPGVFIERRSLFTEGVDATVNVGGALTVVGCDCFDDLSGF